MDWIKDWAPVINMILIPIALAAVSGLKAIRRVDLANISMKFDELIKELSQVRTQITALELRVARLEGIIMKASGIHPGD